MDSQKTDSLLVHSLSSLDETTAISIISKFLQSKPHLAPPVVAFAVPDLTFAPARALLQRRAVGVVKSFSQDAGFGFISCPELGVVFGNDVYVQGQQAAWLQPGMEVNFAVLLDKEQKPQAFDVQPMGAPSLPPVMGGTNIGSSMGSTSIGMSTGSTAMSHVDTSARGNGAGTFSALGGLDGSMGKGDHSWGGKAGTSVGDGMDAWGGKNAISMGESWGGKGGKGGKNMGGGWWSKGAWDDIAKGAGRSVDSGSSGMSGGNFGSNSGPSWMTSEWGHTDWRSSGDWSGKGKGTKGIHSAQTMPDVERWS